MFCLIISFTQGGTFSPRSFVFPLTHHLFTLPHHLSFLCHSSCISFTNMIVDGWHAHIVLQQAHSVRQHGASPYTVCPPSPTLCWRDTPLSHTQVAWRDIPCQPPSSLADGPSSSSKAWQWLHLVEHLARQRAPQHDMSKIINIMAQGYQIAIQAIYSRFFCLPDTSGFKPLSLGHQVCFASLKPLNCTQFSLASHQWSVTQWTYYVLGTVVGVGNTNMKH